MTFLDRDDSIVARTLGATGRTLTVLSLCGLAAWGGSRAVQAGGQCGQQVTRLTAYGFEHNAVDDALLEIDCVTGKLKISNLGSSGCDGFSIDMGDSDGWEVELEEILAPASTQDGAIFSITRDYATASTEWVCEDIGNQVEIRTSFPGFNVSSKTLRVYEVTADGEVILKEEVTGHTGSWDFRIDDPMDPTSQGTRYGGTSGGCRPRLRCGGSSGSGGCRPYFVNGGSGGPVEGNLIEVIAEDFTPVPGSSTLTVQAGAGYSEMIVNGEAILQFPALAHSVIDDAIFEPPINGGKLKISNLGSSGCDGFSINLGESDTFEMNVAEINDGNGLPTGGYTETQVYGTVAGVPDQLITTSRITDTGTELELTKCCGSGSYTIRAYSGGLEVFSGSHGSGVPSARVSDSNPCKSEQHFVLPNLDGLGFPFSGTENFLTVWRWDSPTLMELPGGISVQADELHVAPDGITTPDTLTRFEMRGADVNSIEIGGETNFLCRGGNVGWGLDEVAEDMLWVNGSTGTAGLREVCVGTRERIEVTLDTAFDGPPSAKYFLCAWIGGPQSPTNLIVQNSVVGCFVNPIPLTGGGPQPFRCLRGGLPNAVCRQVRELAGPPRAPFTATKAGGLANPLTLTLQAFLEDDGASHPIGYSVTNAVVLKIQSQ